MKRLFYLMLVVLGTMAFVSCSDDDENNGGEIDEPIEEQPVNYSEIIINTTHYIDDYGNSTNTVSLTVTTFSYGDSINIDYGTGYSQTLTSTELEEPLGINVENKYGCVLEYTFPDEEDHTITIRGNINGLNCDNEGSKYEITSLDVSKCTGLTYLNCDCNLLTSLDISKNTALIDLSCHGNDLTSLDISKCLVLNNLICYENDLTSLDASKCIALTELDCKGNRLTSLNVSGCTALTYLSCYDNQFTATEMNKIYEALPTVEDGSLNCDELGNPSIAEQKGWNVY